MTEVNLMTALSFFRIGTLGKAHQLMNYLRLEVFLSDEESKKSNFEGDEHLDLCWFVKTC